MTHTSKLPTVSPRPVATQTIHACQSSQWTKVCNCCNSVWLALDEYLYFAWVDIHVALKCSCLIVPCRSMTGSGYYLLTNQIPCTGSRAENKQSYPLAVAYYSYRLLLCMISTYTSAHSIGVAATSNWVYDTVKGLYSLVPRLPPVYVERSLGTKLGVISFVVVL